MNQHGFLPISRKEMEQMGVEQFDFVYITGDAYVDHPSFGVAIISRVLESLGFTVGIISQPDWHSDRDFLRFGLPRYAFLVTAGNIDSMVAHYTVAKRPRTTDAYTPGGVMGKRPDRAVTVYSKKLKELAPDVPVLIGGLEASLRRFAHYDYWEDRVKPSVLVDSGADLLMYGMGELQITEIANRFRQGETVSQMTDIRGTCYLTDPVNTPYGAVQCADFEIVARDKKSYAKANRQQMNEQDEVTGRTLIQRHGKKMLVQNPPMRSLTREELDQVYALPYMRMYHPIYEKEGGVPAIEEVEFSIVHNRGCFGACNFCALAFHQGRKVSSRSEESVLEEARSFVGNPRFKGYIHDVGGPTANFRYPSCQKQLTGGMCKDGRKCLAPQPCKLLEVDHTEYLDLLRQIREIPGIKKVFIRSGIRYDYLVADPDETFFDELVRYHVSGQLKVAPEHCSNHVLDQMGKPHIETYLKFVRKFYEKTKQAGKEQYLVPYLMSSHPGSTLNDAIELACFLKKEQVRPEQVQDFYPTPGTVSTCMYYTGLNPFTMEPVYVPKEREEKAMQRALLQYYNPKNYDLIRKALRRAKRFDLIGKGPNALVEDDKTQPQGMTSRQGRSGKTGTTRAVSSRQPLSAKGKRNEKGQKTWQKEGQKGRRNKK
ncbi:MAG: YgiQ family radical SAM protein [Massiliimalia sp.]